MSTKIPPIIDYNRTRYYMGDLEYPNDFFCHDIREMIGYEPEGTDTSCMDSLRGFGVKYKIKFNHLVLDNIWANPQMNKKYKPLYSIKPKPVNGIVPYLRRLKFHEINTKKTNRYSRNSITEECRIDVNELYTLPKKQFMEFVDHYSSVIWEDIDLLMDYTGCIILADEYYGSYDLYLSPELRWHYKIFKQIIFENGILIDDIDISEKVRNYLQQNGLDYEFENDESSFRDDNKMLEEYSDDIVDFDNDKSSLGFDIKKWREYRDKTVDLEKAILNYCYTPIEIRDKMFAFKSVKNDIFKKEIQSFIDPAVQWALKKVGSDEYHLCWKSYDFVRDAFEMANMIGIDYHGDPSEMAIKFKEFLNVSEPPKGALVLFECSGPVKQSTNNDIYIFGYSDEKFENWGHVGLCIGEKMIVHSIREVRVDDYFEVQNLEYAPGWSKPIFIGWVPIEVILKDYRK